ncbi:hypothetical protein, partial [Rhodanobacter sp. 7MK24]|uniref:hypothetical protein n=1 Tax=Rhodanobacter sp. 7MK24 TaxID=2775922 RepID=UPI001CE1ABB0
LSHLRAGLDLLEDPDDLFLAELRLLHAELLGGETLLPTGSNQRGRFTRFPTSMVSTVPSLFKEGGVLIARDASRTIWKRGAFPTFEWTGVAFL